MKRRTGTKCADTSNQKPEWSLGLAGTQQVTTLFIRLAPHEETPRDMKCGLQFSGPVSALSRYLLLSGADKVHHFATLEEFIFLISAWLRINVPFLNFPTCPTFPFDKMLGADFLDLLC